VCSVPQSVHSNVAVVEIGSDMVAMAEPVVGTGGSCMRAVPAG
jgi:hypothetical protein